MNTKNLLPMSKGETAGANMWANERSNKTGMRTVRALVCKKFTRFFFQNTLTNSMNYAVNLDSIFLNGVCS